MKTPKQKLNLILDYCEPVLHYMWAATIVAIILECDFRDVREALKKYRKK